VPRWSSNPLVVKGGFSALSLGARSTAPPPLETPTAITVVRPERTIVRGSDSLLPLILASLALLVALGIAGTALAHQRSVRPGRAA